MATCAVVDVTTNIVTNIIVAEVTDQPPANSVLIEVTKWPLSIGWKWTGTEFIKDE